MQATSATYRTLFTQANTYKEWRISVNGTQYGQDVIVKEVGNTNKEPRVSRPTFLDTPSVGNCYAAQFSCTFYFESSNIPRMATIIPSYRLRNGNQASEWITVGTFYVDVRYYDKASKTTDLVCYDDMLKTDGVEGKTYAELTQFDEWPQPMSAVVQEICTIVGTPLDARSTINTGAGYTIGYPNDYTMREVLGFVAAAHGGNFIISPARALRLIPIVGSTDTVTSLGHQDLVLSEAFSAWSKVTLYYGDEEAYEAGTDTGRTLEAEDPWAEQSTANGILSVISGISYIPFTVSVCLLDPAAELGDTIVFSIGQSTTISVKIWNIDLYCDSTSAVSIGAPGESAVDHEYPYVSSSARQMRRMVKLGQPYYGVTISKQYGIQIVGYDENNDEINRALLNSSVFTMDVKTEGGWEQQFYFDPERRAYVFKGALGADSIYADMGDIAELTVDRLSTSKKVRLYNLQNTSDDNFVHVQDNYIRLTTGSVKYDPNDPTTPLTEQATNRWGDPLYWQAIPDHINASGYPEDEDGRQIYATTDVPTPGEGETLDDYKVMVYQYAELVKSSYEFVLEGGTYVPVLTLGAGDSNGRTKGRLHKSANSFDIEFTDTAGNDMGIHMNSAGYMDIEGLRRATELDFSLFEQGGFSEEVDGGISYYYNVAFDSSGDPVRIYDSAHSTNIIWW